MTITSLLLVALVVVAIWFMLRWWWLERAGDGAERRPRVTDVVTGAIANFFDALGISSFASTTAMFKLFRRVPDEQIPGTLNVGHALPTVAQALIFIAIVTVDPWTLIAMIGAAVAGAWIGVGFIARLPRRAIQIGMGVALLIAAITLLISMQGLIPGGGNATGLSGGRLAFATGISFILGALMMLGVGFYAPCLILVSLLGMNPLVAFPIMMGSCAFLMPIGGARFVKAGRYHLPAALGLAIGGVPAVLFAAYVVKSLPLDGLRWLVIVVVSYAAISMLWSARPSAGRKAD